ncbi:uncharacterized protein [Thunnus thynnus]|uniref:uncharacterized protein n=1 Tax=Thunnus thynnus TaxID=8237 RepID=UPI003528C88B
MTDKAESDLGSLRRMEIRKWRVDPAAYSPPPQLRFMKPFWPPILKRGGKGKKDTSRRSGKEACRTPKATQHPNAGTSRDLSPPFSSGQILEESMRAKVPRTTKWRRQVRQEAVDAGVITPRKQRTCSLCKQRKVRETGHSIHKKTRKTFCQNTDPSGRTVEEWLREIRGGVSTQDLYQANLKRWGSYKYRPDVRTRYNRKRREKRAEERKRMEQEEEKE